MDIFDIKDQEKNNKERLRLFDLPVFDDMSQLSEITHISYRKLWSITYSSYNFYRRYKIPKKNGKFRVIYQPNKDVKAVQAWINHHILRKISPSIHATAFQKGMSIKGNVIPHQSNRYFLCIDLKDFFPSIKRWRVHQLFKNIGYNDDQSKILSKLCTCANFLPQGGITSPAISNLVVGRMDRRISSYCSSKNIIYTRYADDMTFSSNNRNVLNNTKWLITKIIEQEKFEINPSKVHFVGPKKRVQITGLIKNSSEPRFGIGKKRKNHIRSVLFNLLVNNRQIDDKYKDLKSIDGYLSYVKSVDEKSYFYLKRYKDNLLEKITK